MADARRVLRQEAPLGDDVEAGEQPQSLVRDLGHDMAAALDGPELECKHRAQRMAGRDHLRTREARSLGEFVEIEGDEAGNEQEQAATGGLEAPRSQRQLANIGDGLDRRAHTVGALLVQATRQRGKALGFEHFANGGGAEADVASLEGFADLVD
jgi:hypothetical protein